MAQAAVVRWRGQVRDPERDRVAVEEPCEIRLAGESVAVVMRTPGDDAELAVGFLVSEGIVAAGDVAAVTHCIDPDALNPENVVDVRLSPGARPLRGWDRNFFAASSCGICGKATIDSIHVGAPPLESPPRVRGDVVLTCVPRLRDAQAAFEATGGLHAAGVFTLDGEPLVVREDIGRHNAVDKAIGHLSLAGEWPLRDRVLVVSGRTSFEIVQKALVARIPVVAGISAASSLAVELARNSNMALAGFVRGERMVVYAGQERWT